METKSFTITDHTMIVIRTHADLNLQGWDRMDIQPLADQRDTLNISQDGDLVRVNSSSDLDLMVPINLPVTVERASGDAYVRNIHGTLHIARVGGDLTMQNVGMVDVQGVGGDCKVMQSTEALAIQRVGGDFVGVDLAGPVKLDTTGGDVDLQMRGGEAQVRAGGDINYAFQTAERQNIRLHAGGDVMLIMPAEAGVSLDLRSRGHDVSIEYGGQSQQIDKRFHQVTFGDGSTQISIDAGGDIHISDNAEEYHFPELTDDLDNYWEEVEGRREERSTEAEEAFTFRAEELSSKISHRVDEAMRQADARISEAMKRLEQRTRRLERGGFGFGNPPIPPVPPRHPGHPGADSAEKKTVASEEEKLLILKMLQEKKITAEEADKLLEALEG
jgi:hypothetical protein